MKWGLASRVSRDRCAAESRYIAGGSNSACDALEEIMSSKPLPQGSLVLLWAGENPAVHAALLEELEAVGIPFFDKTLGDDEVAPTADPLPIDWKPRFGFEVAVLSTDLAAAKELLEKLLEEEPTDLEIPAQDGEFAAEPPLVVATETHATVEVWKGSDDRIAQFLTAAMQENEI